MTIIHELRYWLFGCDATSEDAFGKVYCTLDRNHDGLHQAWTCSCARGGRCADEENRPVETWA